jgi:hypothetical protein
MTMANKHHHETSGKFLPTSVVRGFRVVDLPTVPPELSSMARPPEPPPSKPKA